FGVAFAQSSRLLVSRRDINGEVLVRVGVVLGGGRRVILTFVDVVARSGVMRRFVKKDGSSRRASFLSKLGEHRDLAARTLRLCTEVDDFLALLDLLAFLRTSVGLGRNLVLNLLVTVF